MKQKSIVRSALQAAVRESKGSLCLLLITVLASAGLSLVPPQLLRLIVDRCLAPRSSDGLRMLAYIYLGVLILTGAADFLKESLLVVLGQKITCRVCIAMMEKLNRVRTAYFSANDTGAIVSRFTNDVDAINDLFANGIVGMSVDCLKVVGIAWSMWLFSARLGVLMLPLIGAVFLFTRAVQKRMLRAQMRGRTAAGRLSHRLLETLKNAHMIKQSGKERFMEDLYRKDLEENFDAAERINLFDSFYSPIIQLMRALTIAFVVLLSSDALGLTGISLGTVAAALDLITGLFAPIENLGMEIQTLQRAVSGVRRVEAFSCEAEDERPKDGDIQAEMLLTPERRVRLRFENVSFSYEGKDALFRNVSFTLETEQKAAVIGRTGIGKSTLLRLVLGVLRPTDGCITLNGVDVWRIPNEQKRKLFGYVGQEFHFVSGTITDQISLKDPAITRAQVEWAIRQAGLEPFVRALPQGYDTQLTADGNFSQGQRQLMAVARAIVCDPPILLLDEVTANLDSVTEKSLLDTLKRTGRGRMILTVSHRLSGILFCDRLVVLEAGAAADVGTPQALAVRNAWYRRSLALQEHSWSGG